MRNVRKPDLKVDASKPAGFEQGAADQEVVQNRREEGYADLVALAWTRRQHPEQYQQVYSWLATLRSEQTVPGGSHDTRAWVNLAADGKVFAPAATPFEQAAGIWTAGLAAND